MESPINWFEIPAVDFERAKKFYSALLERDLKVWDMGPVKMGMLGQSQDTKNVNGAIISGNGSSPAKNGTLVFLNTGKDLAGALKRVEKSGGKVIVPVTAIPEGHGFFAKFEDTEGNAIALYSPN
jgi:uncharacterized protein